LSLHLDPKRNDDREIGWVLVVPNQRRSGRPGELKPHSSLNWVEGIDKVLSIIGSHHLALTLLKGQLLTA
jgi:hypothetical protein